TVSTEPLIFLFYCLLNFGEHQLQEQACETCQRVIADSSQSEIGVPQSYVMIPRIIHWLVNQVGLTMEQLVHSVLIPVLRRISVPSIEVSFCNLPTLKLLSLSMIVSLYI
ncbi:hypothetical protein FGIG_02205, partial [Fasciola gigantica]